MNITQPIIIRKSDVLVLTGLSKSTLYNRINSGLLPSPISLGGVRAVGFVLREVNTVLRAMIAGESQEQIKALVSKLARQRSQKTEGACYDDS